MRFSSTDQAAQLPPNYPFVAADAGSHTFQVTFGTPGTESLSATDVASSSTVGSQSVTVVPGKVFYIVNLANSVTVQAATTTGNVAPIATLSGSNTGLGPAQVNSPYGVARDTAGRLYATVDGSNNSIVVFAAGATGNASPVDTIAGSNTALNYPRGIALDAAGRLYVANSNFSGQGCTPAACGSVTVYAAGAHGNAAPVDTIVGTNTGLDGPVGIVLFSGQLYVANNVSNAITVYASTATGNATPTATLAGSNTGLAGPQGIAFDAAGRLYVTNASSNSVTVYAAGATGNASPVATITGSNTGLSGPLGIALDAAGRVYVANESVNSVTVYAAGATGNASPVATIAGSSTGLNQPTFITF
ncbi:MAG TPA: NHL repeat-containing protein [bacterium]|nr:NHL repeat-containing protein [bacterium]